MIELSLYHLSLEVRFSSKSHPHNHTVDVSGEQTPTGSYRGPTISHRISKNSAIILEYYLMNNEDNNSLKFQEFQNFPPRSQGKRPAKFCIIQTVTSVYVFSNVQNSVLIFFSFFFPILGIYAFKKESFHCIVRWFSERNKIRFMCSS